LFKYPEPRALVKELEFFWKGGANDLDKEESLHEEEMEGLRSESKCTEVNFV
jgi:hypothetical protein